MWNTNKKVYHFLFRISHPFILFVYTRHTTCHMSTICKPSFIKFVILIIAFSHHSQSRHLSHYSSHQPLHHLFDHPEIHGYPLIAPLYTLSFTSSHRDLHKAPHQLSHHLHHSFQLLLSLPLLSHIHTTFHGLLVSHYRSHYSSIQLYIIFHSLSTLHFTTLSTLPFTSLITLPVTTLITLPITPLKSHCLLQHFALSLTPLIILPFHTITRLISLSFTSPNHINLHHNASCQFSLFLPCDTYNKQKQIQALH